MNAENRTLDVWHKFDAFRNGQYDAVKHPILPEIP
jgi:hypothetical protein